MFVVDVKKLLAKVIKEYFPFRFGIDDKGNYGFYTKNGKFRKL